MFMKVMHLMPKRQLVIQDIAKPLVPRVISTNDRSKASKEKLLKDLFDSLFTKRRCEVSFEHLRKFKNVDYFEFFISIFYEKWIKWFYWAWPKSLSPNKLCYFFRIKKCFCPSNCPTESNASVASWKIWNGN